MTHFFKTRNWFAGITSVLVVLLGLTLVAQEADARRLGGGKSFGRQSQGVTKQQAAPQQPAQNAAAPAQPAQPAGNRWLGPLGGLAAGLGISALLSHFGMMGPFASAMGSVLMIGLLVFGGILLWRLFASRSNSGVRPERNSVFNQRTEPAMQSGPIGSTPSGSTNVYGAPLRGTPEVPVAASLAVPADFDQAAFLRNARVYFTRLQAAWDAKDFGDIRKFTTPEAFAEIKMQSDEAPGQIDRTEISNLDAALLGVETTASEYVASVRFTGLLSENGATSQAFEEVWNLAKPVDGSSGWLLAGIQQVH